MLTIKIILTCWKYWQCKMSSIQSLVAIVYMTTWSGLMTKKEGENVENN